MITSGHFQNLRELLFQLLLKFDIEILFCACFKSIIVEFRDS